MTARRPLRRQRTRGAALVEYALFVSLLVGATLGATEAFSDNAGDRFETTSDDIGAKREPILGVAPSTTAPPTTAAPPTTSTTAPTTTTTAPTTTTTAPTTTTTAPTTTTTAPPTSLQITSSSSTVVWKSGRNGAWRPDVTFDYGWRNGADVTIRITSRHGDGSTASTEVTVWIGPNGRTDIQYFPEQTIHASASKNVVSVDVTVLRIQTQDENWTSRSFNVSGTSVTITAP